MWGVEGGNLLWQKRFNILKLLSAHQPPYSSPAQRGTAAQHCCCGKSAFLCTRHPRLTCNYTCSHILSAPAPVSVTLCHMEPSPETHGVPKAHLHSHPSVLARGRCEQISLKPGTPQGFSTTVPTSTLKRKFQRMWEWRPTEKIQHKAKQWDLAAWKKGFTGADESATTQKVRSCSSRTTRRAKKPRHPEFQDNTSKMPYHTHHSCWLQALQTTCYQPVGVRKALGKQPQTQGRIMGREENERKKKLDRDQTLPHGTEQ